MRIAVDLEVCMCNGLCVQSAPELFRFDDEGFPSVANAELDPSLVDEAQRAARLCPTMAITIEA